MSEKLQYLRSGFFSYSGKIITIMSSFVYTLLIANFLGPEKYGLVNYYISFAIGLIGIFGINFFSGLLSVFMPKWKSKAFLKYVLCVVFALSIVLFASLFLFSGQISLFLGKSNFELLQITSILLLIMPFVLVYSALFRSFKMFGKELKFNLVVAVFNLMVAFFFVIVFGYGVFGVVYAMAVSNVIGLVFLILWSRRLKYQNKSIDVAAIKTYCKFGVPATFLRRIDTQIFLVFMGLFIADNELGMYYIAIKITSIALSIPINTLTEVLLPYVSELQVSKNRISRYVSLNVKFSLILMVIVSIFIILFSKLFLSLFFSRYVEAYPYILLFTIFFVLSSLNPLANLYLSLNRMDVIAKSFFGGLMSTIVFGLVLIPIFGVFGLIITQIMNVLVSRGIFVYSLKSVGFDVGIVPKRDDFVYFWRTLKNLFVIMFKKRM